MKRTMAPFIFHQLYNILNTQFMHNEVNDTPWRSLEHHPTPL